MSTSNQNYENSLIGLHGSACRYEQIKWTYLHDVWQFSNFQGKYSPPHIPINARRGHTSSLSSLNSVHSFDCSVGKQHVMNLNSMVALSKKIPY